MRAANTLILCVGIMFAAPTLGSANAGCCPCQGRVAVVGEARHKLRIVSTTDTIVEAYPTLSWFVVDPMFGKMHAVETWLSFRYAGHSGRMVGALTEVLACKRANGGPLAHQQLFGPLRPRLAAIHGLAATLTIFRRAETRQVAAAPRFGLLSDTRG